MSALVLCMAGLYKRFRDAGYATPKFLLPLEDPGGRGGAGPLLRHLAAPLVGQVDEVLLVANRRDLAFETRIRDAMASAGAPDADLLWVDDTEGQAATAAIGARAVRSGGPVLFHNIDTLLLGRDVRSYAAALADADGLIDVFPERDPAYSYVALEQTDGAFARVVDIAEKIVISTHATTGLYGFASAAAYLDAAAGCHRRSAGEFYVSDVYRSLLDRGARIVAPNHPQGHRTVVLGTPAEYEAWVRR